MRKFVVLAFVVVGAAGPARAQQGPLDPYGAQIEQPGQGYAAPANAYPPPAYPYQAPAAAYPPPPVYPPPQPQLPAGVPTPGYYYPPPGYAAPIYSYPPPPVYYVRPPVTRRPVLNCAACVERPEDRARFFSIGMRGTVLGINQKINGQGVVMGGVGFQMRFRTRGRFGMEASVDILHAGFNDHGNPPLADATTGDSGTSGGAPSSPPPTGGFNTPGSTSGGPYFHSGPVTRDSVPVTLSALVYIFPNQDSHIFNLYFLGGMGVVATTMGLTDEWGAPVKQSFSEFETHLGVGMELRFHWFALQADVRGIGLWRDDSSAPGAYYTGVDGAPVPANSWGLQGSAGAAFWF